jgi:hypothetical protein
MITKILRGKGTILQNEQEILSGFYNIKKISGPDVITHLFGTFDITGISDISLLTRINTTPPPELILILNDKTKYKINLISSQFDATSYKIVFIT